MAQAPYVNYGGSLRLMQPYLAKQVGFYGFVLKGDVDALQKTCTERLNAPAGGAVRFEPAGPYVILAFNALRTLSSKNLPDSSKGTFSENECALWVPVIDRVQEKSYWFHPYIFVDNPFALALGREVYGFPKSLGVFDIPPAPDPAQSFSMQTWVLPQYSPDTQGELAELVKVSPTAAAPENFWSRVTEIEEFVGEIAGALGEEGSIVEDVELALHTIDDLLRRRAPMVFLKQFPDAADPTTACYMSLVEAPSNMTEFHHGGLMRTDYDVSFTPCDSHPIAKDLGFATETVKPLLSFFVEFDFEIDGGVEIWKA